MSYLNTPRLTFSGQFQADPSTVNNDPIHFNNATFQPSFQDYTTAAALNGWWNPDGTGNWRLIGCTVTSVTYQDGTVVTDPAVDPIVGASIMDTDKRTAAKIVDLDSQQQMVSEIWGMVVRIVSAKGVTLLRGNYEVAAFTNIWFNRSVDQSLDSAAAAVYQSVIKDLEWTTAGFTSRYLNELQSASGAQGCLSINFNVDRYNGDNTSPQFTIGRLAGAIGPCFANEPDHFVLGRQLFPQLPPPPQNPTCNYATAIYDVNSKTVVLDLGNALQYSTGGVINETRDLRLMLVTGTGDNPGYIEIGKINYSAANWYMGASGICAFNVSAQLALQFQQYPIAIVQATTTPPDVFTLATTTTYSSSPYLYESVQYVRADKFVYRIDPGGTQPTINFYATNLGAPVASGTTINILQSGEFNGGNPPYPIPFPASIPNPPPANNPALPQLLPPNEPPQPQNGVPTGALQNISADQTTPTIITTDTNGLASITLQVQDPGLVREFQYYQLNQAQTEYVLASYDPPQYMDGQYYSLTYYLNGQNPANLNSSNTVSILIFNGNQASWPANPGWDNFIQPIMQQYANLYPLMSKGIFNLADKSVIDSNAQILYTVFSKDPADPNYMPATRDLSAYKRSVILNYLQAIISGQTPTSHLVK